LPVFTYKATDDQGKIVDGRIEAKSVEAVISRLQHLSFYPLEVKEGEEPEEGKIRPLGFRWRKRKRIVYFTGQLSTLLDAGLPVDRSLAIAEELTDDRRLAQVIGRLRNSVEEGNTLAEAMEEHPSYFNQLYVNMIRAGESGGALEIVLRRLNEFLEESQRIREFIASSLAYPLFLVIFSMGALTVIITYVLPQFAEIFTDMGAAIPLPARILMSISEFIGRWWWLMLAVSALIVFVFISWIKTAPGRLWWDRHRLGWPLMGPLYRKLEAARFARTLGTLMASGVPILQGVDIVGEIVGNRHISGFMDEVKEGLKKGEGLVAPLKKAGVFPPLFIHMTAVGEETGQLEEMLIKVAAIFEGEIENTTRSLLSMLEPVIIVTLGLVLGSIILSVLWAIFSVYGTF
jgi:general secretion pathway protein F